MFPIKLTVLLMIALTGVRGQQIQFPINTVAVVGDTAILCCAYYSYSCLQISWQRRNATGQVTNISDGNTVYDVNKYRLDVSSVCDLVIQNVQASDSVTFICTVAGSRYGLADLVVLDAKPSCSTSCEKDSTAEKDNVDFKCKLTYSGGSGPAMNWWNKKTQSQVPDVPPQKRDGGTVSRDFSKNAAAPEVDTLICLTRFRFDPTPGRASNVPEVQCETDSCDILYSVRNVVTSPELYASPGEEITCKADGNPKPSFEWQWKEETGDGEWMDVPDAESDTIEAFPNNGTSYKLRCVAKNSFRGVDYCEYSPAVTVSKNGSVIRTAIIVGVVVGVVVLVIIAGLVCKFFFTVWSWSRDITVIERITRRVFTAALRV